MPKNVSDKDLNDLEKSAEQVLGQPAGDFYFVQRTSLRTWESGAAQEAEPIINGVRYRCVYVDGVIEVSGRSRTGANGSTVWTLRSLIVPCDGMFEEFGRPMSFVGTPHSSDPIYLTISPADGFFLPIPPTDVTVDVFTWDRDGNPAPNIAFSWRFRAPFTRSR